MGVTELAIVVGVVRHSLKRSHLFPAVEGGRCVAPGEVHCFPGCIASNLKRSHLLTAAEVNSCVARREVPCSLLVPLQFLSRLHRLKGGQLFFCVGWCVRVFEHSLRRLESCR